MVCVKNVGLDDESVLENISVAESDKLTTTTLPLTATQQALLLGLWSVFSLAFV